MGAERNQERHQMVNNTNSGKYEVVWMNDGKPMVSETLASSVKDARDQFVARVVRVTYLGRA
jgi:23S rRNA pseudoU1915 N3-methylase RlmH